MPTAASSSEPRPMSFGAFVTARRKRLGLSMRELARRVNVNAAQLLRWEAGRHVPREAVTLYALATHLRIGAESVDALLAALTKLSIQHHTGVTVVCGVEP